MTLWFVVYDIDDDAVVLPGVHYRGPDVDALPPVMLPLCWTAEGKQRGATDEEWILSVDQGALPSTHVTDQPELVDCRECREWMHA